jgi:hypothetical protein
MNPVDPTGFLCVDVQVLRTGLLNVKGKLAPMVDGECEDPALLKEAVEQALDEINKTLVEKERVEAEQGANK